MAEKLASEKYTDIIMTASNTIEILPTVIKKFVKVRKKSRLIVKKVVF